MPVDDSDFGFRHFEVPGEELEYAGVRQVAFRFLADADLEVVGADLLKGFFF